MKYTNTKITFEYFNLGVKSSIFFAASLIFLLCFSAAQNASAKMIDEAVQESQSQPTVKRTLLPQHPAVGGVDAGFAAAISEENTQGLSLAVQPDGKFLVGGFYTGVGGVQRGSLERFNADGTRDTTFNSGGVGANSSVCVILVLPGGKIMISGGFTSYNGATALRIARLNADGTLDTTFTVRELQPMPVSKIRLFNRTGKF